MFGECCPMVVPKVLMRSSFVTQTSNDAKQTLLADGEPQTIQFNVVSVPDITMEVNLTTGEFTDIKAFYGMASISVSCLRELTGAGNIDWGVFLEGYTEQTGWTAYEGSLRPITLNTQTTNEKRTIDFTLAVEIEAGAKFRWRHYTSDASKTVSIVSFASANGLPSSAGVIFSLWGVKP